MSSKRRGAARQSESNKSRGEEPELAQQQLSNLLLNAMQKEQQVNSKRPGAARERERSKSQKGAAREPTAAVVN